MPFYEDYGSNFYLYHLKAAGNSAIMHIHPHWEMLFVPTPEESKFTVNGNSYVTSGPYLCLFSPYCLHKVEFIDVYKPIERFVCYFGDDLIKNYPTVFENYPHAFSKHFLQIPLSEEQAEQCRKMVEQTELFPLHSKEQSLLFLLILCTALNAQKVESDPDTPTKQPQISHIIQYMQEHLSENIDADTVSQHFYISRSKLDKDFQKHTEVSFRQLLIHMRLSHAAYLLASNKSLKVNDIAAMSGFENENYFNAQFKRFYGTTPLKYQKDSTKYRRMIISDF